MTTQRKPKIGSKVKLLLSEVIYPEDYDLLTSDEGVIKQIIPDAENGETLYRVEFSIALPDGRDPWYNRETYGLLHREFEVLS
ncbi:MAG TPA: hypothetical protein VFU31_22135 [Candidatus Binatia bacterium]|nr:hypothetical protein [Candidatus Binatia bacterium]